MSKGYYNSVLHSEKIRAFTYSQLCTTMMNEIVQFIEEVKRAEITSFYNLTKGAVDVVDEMGATYCTARISNR